MGYHRKNNQNFAAAAAFLRLDEHSHNCFSALAVAAVEVANSGLADVSFLAHLCRLAFAFLRQLFQWCIDLGRLDLAIYGYAKSPQHKPVIPSVGIHRLFQLIG